MAAKHIKEKFAIISNEENESVKYKIFPQAEWVLSRKLLITVLVRKCQEKKSLQTVGMDINLLNHYKRRQQ